MDRPLVTIGIAAFDAAETVEAAVRSALAQAWRPIEIVAVDDASTDGTLRTLSRLAQAHPELRLFRQETNGGVASTRNRMIAEARGEFLAFFDDDDESAPDRVEAQVARIVAYERDFAAGAPVVCYAARRLIYPDGAEAVAPTIGQIEGRAAPSGMPVAARVLLGTPLADGYGACPTCSLMARLSVFGTFGGFDPKFRRSEDTDFNVRLAMAGGHFVGVARPLVTQRMTKTSDKSLADEYRYTIQLLDKHRDVADRFGGYGFARAFIELKQAWLEGRMGVFAARLLMLGLRYPGMSTQRLMLARANMKLNRAFRRFHAAPQP